VLRDHYLGDTLTKIETMGKYHYKLTCDFKVDPKSFIHINDKLEITLPCITCHRANRTIVFETLDESGICTPREKCEGFQGELIKKDVVEQSNGIQVNFLIDFEYASFKDLKYKVESNFKHGWARVYFKLKCSNCSNNKTISTQENLGRPRSIKCNCGETVYEEHQSPFTYEAIEVK